MIRTVAGMQFWFRIIRAWLAAVVVSTLIGTPAQASGPLREAWIPDGSDWVVHVDAQRLSQADNLQPIFDALAASGLGASLSDMGIDPRLDLLTITMFGTITRGPDQQGETTTMLVGGPALRTAIHKHVEKHNGYMLMLPRAWQAQRRDIDAWTLEGMAVHIALVPSAQPRDEQGSRELVAVLADNSERLRACVKMLMHEPDGSLEPPMETVQNPTQAGKPGSILDGCSPPEGSVIFASVRNLNESHPPLTSGLLASAESMVAHLGYRGKGKAQTVFAGMDLLGHEAADVDGVVSSLNHMIDYWSDRVAELSRSQPSMLAMLPLIEACDVSKNGRLVKLQLGQSAITSETEERDRGRPTLVTGAKPESPGSEGP